MSRFQVIPKTNRSTGTAEYLILDTVTSQYMAISFAKIEDAGIECATLNLTDAQIQWRAAKEQREGRASIPTNTPFKMLNG